MKTFLLFLFTPLLLWSCDSLKSTGPVHETKITVQLSGEFKNDESADVSIAGGGITTISAGHSAYATVEPGTHTILATARVLKGTWSHTTTIKAGESKLIYAPCDKASLTVAPDILWLGKIDKFLIEVISSDGRFTFTATPGVPGSISLRPRKGVQIVIRDFFTFGIVAQETRDFFYQDKFTLTVPYR